MPSLSRPHFGYGIPDTEPEGASWEATEEKLAASRNYWICTARADGRGHAKPVWGLWLEHALWFSTGGSTVTGRNLTRDPRVSVHLESGDDTVILEGTVEHMPREAAPPQLGETYCGKYALDPQYLSSTWYRLAPTIAMTWLEPEFQKTAAFWAFE